MTKGPPGQVVPTVLAGLRARTGRAGLGRGSVVPARHGDGPVPWGWFVLSWQEGFSSMLEMVRVSVAACGPKAPFTSWTMAGWFWAPTVTGLVNAGVTLPPSPATWPAARLGTRVAAPATRAIATISQRRTPRRLVAPPIELFRSRTAYRLPQHVAGF